MAPVAASSQPLHDRLPALDRMRGLVIALMAVDHASEAFNAGRFRGDAAWLHEAGSPIPTDQFLLRWITHLCAPAFFFLMGAAMALKAGKDRAAGLPQAATDRYLVARGAILILLDLGFVSLFWGEPAEGVFLFGVLAGLGMALLVLVPLRRLRPRALLLLALAGIAAHELVLGLLLRGALEGADPRTFRPGPWIGVGLSGGFVRPLFVIYPLLPWCLVAVLGHAFGTVLPSWSRARTERILTLAGLAALAVFVVVRLVDGYGNLLLLRGEHTLVRWLHVSKYPPSVSFLALELGLLALVLAGLSRFGPAAQGQPGVRAPFRLLGSAALFFYVLHIPLLEGAAAWTGLHRGAGIGAALLAALGVVLVALPPCAFYLRLRRRHPQSLLRFL
ncbi:MAG: DUF1624 domain-containing protein [Planctomycetes bacterium]|nr:DUF1624 domain-containing protein [Planctomycetota bacterium]